MLNVDADVYMQIYPQEERASYDLIIKSGAISWNAELRINEIQDLVDIIGNSRDQDRSSWEYRTTDGLHFSLDVVKSSEIIGNGIQVDPNDEEVLILFVSADLTKDQFSDRYYEISFYVRRKVEQQLLDLFEQKIGIVPQSMNTSE